MQRAAAAGHEVLAIVRSGSSGHGASRTVRVGGLGKSEIEKALAGCEAVVHCAARVHVMRDEGAAGRPAFREVNTDGTRNVIEAARAAGASRFVYLSTAKVHGEGRATPYLPGDPLAPIGEYAASKAAAEEAIVATDGIAWTIIRPPLVYGPHVGGNFRRLLTLASLGATVPLPLGGLDNRRSLVSVTNLADAIIGALRTPATRGKRYLVSDRHDLSTTELIRALGAALGQPVRLFALPSGALRTGLALIGKSAESARLLDSFAVDSSALWMDLGAGPTQTTAVAFAEVAAWWQSRSRS